MMTTQTEQDYFDFDAINPDDDRISDAEWDAMTPEAQKEYMRLCENRDIELKRLLLLIPACEVHGHECIPHAWEWVRAHRERDDFQQEAK